MNLLHAGCGSSPLPPFWGDKYSETRLDIDATTNPDVIASLTDLGDIGPFDVVYCSHCVEHLYPHDVRVAVAEFYRVTAEGGSTVIIVPDLEDVKVTDEPIYDCAYGWLSGLDLIYGCRYDVPGNPYMAHHSGFTSKLLEGVMREAGFRSVTMKRLPNHNLMGVGIK